MDWIQFPFEVDAQLHLGAGAPKVRLRWLFTDEPWLKFDGGMHIMNRIWDEDQVSVLPVGELPVKTANYRQDARWHLTPGLKGKHLCHEEWIQNGEPWPNDLPDTLYDANWVPLCCFDPDDPTAGGLEIGGSAGDRIYHRDPTAGGLVIGGRVGDAGQYIDPTAGGLEIGGSVAGSTVYTDPTAGGMEIGGSAGDRYGYIDPTAGGLEIGGSVSSVPSYTDPTAGGMEIGGGAGDVLDQVDGSAGGMEIGGEAGDVLDQVDGTAGGMELGGEAGDVYSVPRVFCTVYNIPAISATVSTSNSGGVVDRIWTSSSGTVVLKSPPETGTSWVLTDSSTASTWTGSSGWDGHGSQSFALIFGSGPFVVTVTCDH